MIYLDLWTDPIEFVVEAFKQATRCKNAKYSLEFPLFGRHRKLAIAGNYTDKATDTIEQKRAKSRICGVLLMIAAEKMVHSTAEYADIVALIEAETAAFLDQDIDRLCSCWIQEPYLQHTTILPYCGVVQVNGIAGLRIHMLARFENEQSLTIKPEAIGRKNWKIVVRESMAWVTFEQFGITDSAAHMFGLQMHTRVLEKTSACWKLVASTIVLSRFDFYECPKIHVDASAKVLQANQAGREAVADHPVLEISGGRLSAITRKDAIRLRNAINEAQKVIESGNAHLPVPLIFGEESSSDSSICWIAILDMMIVVLLNDLRVIKRVIGKAGEVYNLSQTQMRVAEEIATGKDLNCIAITLEVSTNTVRTHVKRMFERVGVSSQKALMKKLLSVQSPAVGLNL